MPNIAALPIRARVDLDLVEKFLVATFLGVLASRQVPVVLANPLSPSLALLISEGVVVLFVLLRRPTQEISRRGGDWVVGLSGTLLPLMAAAPDGTPLIPIATCLTLMGFGFILQLWAKLTLRRSFGVVAANRGVKASGPYRIVRHPMYAGYALTHFAFLLSGPSWWNFAIYGSTLAIAVRRILAEERVLGVDPAYDSLRARVRYRLLPFVF